MRKLVLQTALTVAAIFMLVPASHAAPAVTGEFPVGGTPRALTMGPDGNIWVLLGTGDNEVARITPAGEVTGFDNNDLSSAGGIVAGPDGNLWVSRTNQIVKFAPADPTTETATTIIEIGSAAKAIVVGPDGNLWTASDDKIIKIPPTNPAAYSFTTVANLSARGVARSGDLIWVADFDTTGGGEVHRVTTAGVATPQPTGADAGVQGIAGGPNGQVAYGIPNGANTLLGRLSPGGSPLNTPLGATDPFGVTFGEDGAYWFAQFATNDLGRLTPAGAYTTLAFSEGSGPREITTGPNNTLWVSLETAQKVGRVSGVVAPTTPPPPGTDTTTPVVSRLRLSRKTFRKGTRLPRAAAVRTGTQIRFRLSEAASVRLTFERKLRGRTIRGRCVKPTRQNRTRKACTRYKRARGAITVAGRAGANSVRFQGRLNRRRSLRPGRYRMTVVATDAAGNASARVRASFRLLPKKKAARR